MAWDMVRIIDVPIERLRFERDPFDLPNVETELHISVCPCEACRWQRGIKAAMLTAVSDQQIEAIAATLPTPPAAPYKPEIPATAITTSEPISGFDVQGSLETTPSAQENDDDEGFVDLPPSLAWFCEMADRLCRWMAGMFYVAALAPRAERRRLLRLYLGEDAQ